jgi:hypothetical protein
MPSQIDDFPLSLPIAAAHLDGGELSMSQLPCRTSTGISISHQQNGILLLFNFCHSYPRIRQE